jgi:hypothetical protein
MPAATGNIEPYSGRCPSFGAPLFGSARGRKVQMSKSRSSPASPARHKGAKAATAAAPENKTPAPTDNSDASVQQPPLSDEIIDRLRRFSPEQCISRDRTVIDRDMLLRADYLLRRLDKDRVIPKDWAIDEYGFEPVGLLIDIDMVVADGKFPKENLTLAPAGYRLLADADTPPKGGRKPKWAALLDVNDELRPRGVQDPEIVNTYNKRFANRNGRPKATVKNLRDARDTRNRSGKRKRTAGNRSIKRKS